MPSPLRGVGLTWVSLPPFLLAPPSCSSALTVRRAHSPRASVRGGVSTSSSRVYRRRASLDYARGCAAAPCPVVRLEWLRSAMSRRRGLARRKWLVVVDTLAAPAMSRLPPQSACGVGSGDTLAVLRRGRYVPPSLPTFQAWPDRVFSRPDGRVQRRVLHVARLALFPCRAVCSLCECVWNMR